MAGKYFWEVMTMQRTTTESGIQEQIWVYALMISSVTNTVKMGLKPRFAER